MYSAPVDGHVEPHAKLELQSVTAKGPLQIPGRRGDFQIAGNTEPTARESARVGTLPLNAALVDLR
eukprot:7280095-Pyramimonas_sp.AAC.1